MSDEVKDGNVLVTEVGQVNTLDVLLDRDPTPMSEEDFRNLITFMREERAQWNIKQQVKKEKKEEE